MVEFDGLNLMNRIKPSPDTISQEEIFNYGKSLSDPQDRALFYFLFLTGTRISEALQVQARDFYPSQVVIREKAVSVIGIDLLTLKKRRGIPRRTVYIHPLGEDAKMLKVIEEWRATRLSQDSMIFDFGKITQKDGTKRPRDVAYHRIHDKLMFQVRAMRPDGRWVILEAFHPFLHYLRHCRADNLRKIYGYDAKELQVFFNWSSIAPGERYTHATPIGLLEKMIARRKT